VHDRNTGYNLQLNIKQVRVPNYQLTKRTFTDIKFALRQHKTTHYFSVNSQESSTQSPSHVINPDIFSRLVDFILRIIRPNLTVIYKQLLFTKPKLEE